METRKIIINNANTTIHGLAWMPDGDPKRILQITHGMTEHIGRYEALAQELTGHGVMVAGFDLPGHGESTENHTVASFGRNGWNKALEQMKKFSDLLAQEFPHTPHSMLGFSLGSFLLRDYLCLYPHDTNSIILAGTGWQSSFELQIAKSIVKKQMAKIDPDQTNDQIRSLSFGNYNKKFQPNRTKSDWLCSDNEQLDKYLADPLCCQDISVSLFYDLLDSMKRCGRPDAYKVWEKDMPVLLLSGKDDPVGNFGKGVTAVQKKMAKAGLTNVRAELLENARHDVFHEEASGAAQKAREIIANYLGSD